MSCDKKLFGVLDWLAPDWIRSATKPVFKKIGIRAWEELDVPPVIPLFLCRRRGDLKRQGAFCPYEFIVELGDLLPVVSDEGKLLYDPIPLLEKRLAILSKKYGTYERVNFEKAMRDWLAGTFRLYMMLDASTHGMSRFIDLWKASEREDPILMALVYKDIESVDANLGEYNRTEEYQEKKKENINQANELRFRFASGKYEIGIDDSELLRLKPYLKTLFGEYFQEWGDGEERNLENVERSITKVVTWEGGSEDDKLAALAKIYEDGEKIWDEETHRERPLEHKERLPVAYGDRAKYITPTDKLNLLLVDDDVEASPLGKISDKASNSFTKTVCDDDWDLLREVFNVQELPVKGNGGVREFVRKRFSVLQQLGMTYDVILIDLCLGSMETNSDPDGYSVIRLAKLFFPGTPIVVYSRFKDMGHIARAFFSGARWFLIKGEEAKLPRHVLRLIKHAGWHREWRGVDNSAERPQFECVKNDEFSRKFKRTREWQYLTYKCLEYLPGRMITVQKMGGGISSAVTFKATKGVKMGKKYLQMPSILKIDSSFNTMMEFERYFRMIRPYMANEAGRIEKPELIINREYSAIVYTFAGKQDAAHELRAMSEMVENDMLSETTCDFEKYRYALNCVFDEILPKIHCVSPTIELGCREISPVSDDHMVDAFSKNFDSRSDLSFPNPYFDECFPKEFWKSYVMRFQPWGRIPIDNLSELQVQERVNLDSDNVCIDPSKLKHRLTFHSTMADPVNKGRMLIEAYTDNMQLLWLDGDASDFIARFRKHIQPGSSLWFKNAKEVCHIGQCSCNNKENCYAGDFRLQWLNTSLMRGWRPTSAQDQRTEEPVDFFLNEASELSENDEIKLHSVYCSIQDEVINIAKHVAGQSEEWNCKCPVGIVHGDLNLANVMLESRLHAPKEDEPDTKSTVSDVWFIDFARTRRDIIAHDFNVYFTSVLSALFHPALLSDESYQAKLKKYFKTLVVGAITSEAKSLAAVPDAFKDDARLAFVYKMLRRGREAALKAGVSQNMYTLTTALACLYTMKIFLNNRPKKIKDPKFPIIKAAGFLAAAKICYDLLPSEMQKARKAKA